MKRRIATGFALGLALLLVGLVGLTVYRTTVAQWWLSNQLTERGFTFAELEVTALGLGEAQITGITAGREQELHVKEVTLTYRWPELFSGQFAGISVGGLTLNLDLTGDDPPLGSLDEVFGPLLAESEAAGPPEALPNIEVRNAKVVARTRIGPVVLTAGGLLGPIGDQRTPGDFEFAVAADQGQISGHLDFTVDANTRLDGKLVLEPGTLGWGAVGLELVVAGGTIDFLTGIDAVERVTADLALDALRLEGRDFGAGNLAVSLLGKALTVKGAYGDAREGSGIELSLETDDWDAAPRLIGSLRLGAVAGDFPWQLGGLARPTNGRADLDLSLEGEVPPASALRDAAADPKALIRQLALDAELNLRLSDWALPEQVDSFSATLPIAAHLADGQIRASLSLDAQLREAAFLKTLLDQAGLPAQFLGETQEIELAGLESPTFELIADLTQPEPELRFRGEIRLEAPKRLKATLAGEARIARDSSDQAFTLSFDGVTAQARSPDLRELPIGALTLDGRVSGRFALDAKTGTDEDRVILSLDALSLDLKRDDDRPLTILGHAGVAQITGGDKGAVRFKDWRLELPEVALLLEGLSAELPLGPAEARRAPFTIGAVKDTTKPPRFAPGRVNGRLDLDKNSYRLAADFLGPSAAGPLVLTGTHDLASGRGSLQLAPKTLNFKPKELQPADFSPRLAALKKASGKAEVVGGITWGPKGAQGQVSLAIDGFSTEAEGNKISGLRLALHLAPLFPKVGSPPSQRLFARKIQAAVPLENLQAEFRILPREPTAILIEQADFTALGGRFRVTDTLWYPESQSQEAVVQVLGLDLAGLLEQLKLEGVKGSGDLVGLIPVRVEDGRVIVSEASLRAERPGHLQFKSEAATQMLSSGGEPVRLLLQALEDFHYEVLSLTGTKNGADELDLKLQLLGRNPEVLDGHPFKFNINLSGNIGPILEALAQGSEVSGEALRRSWRLRP